MPTAREVLNASLSEAEFQTQVFEYATLRKWLIFHNYNAIHSHKGFPDACMVRPREDRKTVLWFIEFKRQKGGRVSMEQILWAEKITEIMGITSGLVSYARWRPSDWPEIQKALA